MATHKLVIRPERRLRAVLLRLLALLAFAGLVYGAYYVGVRRGLGDARGALVERDRLRSASKQWESRLEALRGESARLESAQRIDREANEQVRSNLDRLQQENLQLREELQFYRSIVAPSQRQEGVQVQHFSVEPSPGSRRFRYKLTLINLQGIKGRKEVARGDVQLYVDGKQKGRPRRLNLQELGVGGDGKLEYSIKYFKHFEGELRLPEDFVAESAVVEVNPRDDNEGAMRKQVQWPEGATS